MNLLLGQLVYTSFAGIGFRNLASAEVPMSVEQAFIQCVAFRHWNAYNPPKSGYRAVYLYQVTPEHSLFGWLYEDGEDDIGRNHVPYFHSYYLREPLLNLQLEIIFTCLQQGPVALIDRHNLPASLETMVLPDLWSYQPARPGVAIPLDVCKRSHIALKQGELLDLFVPIDQQEMVIEPDGQTYKQQRPHLSIYTPYLLEGIEMGVADLNNQDAAAIETRMKKPYQEYQEKLQRYEQALVEATQRQYPISDRTRNMLKLWQQVLQLKDEDIEPIEARIAQQTKGHCSNQSIIICACW